MDTIKKGSGHLQQSEERYHKMIAEVQDYAIILLDTDGNIQNWNLGAQKIKGYTAQEAIGRNFRIFYKDEDRIALLPENLINEAKVSGRSTHEGWRVRKDGSVFWGLVVITALHEENGTIIGFSDLNTSRNDLNKVMTLRDMREKGIKILHSNGKEDYTRKGGLGFSNTYMTILYATE